MFCERVMRVLALSAMLPVGGAIFFFLFWRWFDHWRSRPFLTYSLVLGIMLAVPAVAYAWALFTLAALWFTRQEERRLVELLDDPGEYERYRRRVPALFPRIGRAVVVAAAAFALAGAAGCAGGGGGSAPAAQAAVA